MSSDEQDKIDEMAVPNIVCLRQEWLHRKANQSTSLQIDDDGWYPGEHTNSDGLVLCFRFTEWIESSACLAASTHIQIKGFLAI
jgi:hypothetical protein